MSIAVITALRIGFCCLEDVSIAAEKILACFVQYLEFVRPLFDIFKWHVIPTRNEITDKSGHALAVGIVGPLQIEDWKDVSAVKPKTCALQAFGQRPWQARMRAMGLPDFKTRFIRSGSLECQTTPSQSVATNNVRPPGFKTRNASATIRSTSGTYSATCMQTATSKDASACSTCVASPTEYESQAADLRRLHNAIKSGGISMPATAPLCPTTSAILSQRKPGPQPYI